VQPGQVGEPYVQPGKLEVEDAGDTAAHNPVAGRVVAMAGKPGRDRAGRPALRPRRAPAPARACPAEPRPAARERRTPRPWLRRSLPPAPVAGPGETGAAAFRLGGAVLPRPPGQLRAAPQHRQRAMALARRGRPTR
jgi:hypothetical protein